ncbi:MAG: glycosyltransferase family 4 protein [Ignavibacteriales bacterium]|nr:glycosyltransferase family 4 protein [Ignavibacteriales bacterium]
MIRSTFTPSYADKMQDRFNAIKRKVLFISLYTEIGGGEIGLFHLLENLDKSRYQPIVIFNKSGPLVEKLGKIGIQTTIIPFVVAMLQQCIIPRIFWSNFKASLEIKRYIKRQQIDIIQCSDVLSLLLLFPAMFFNRITVVFSVIFFYERLRALLLNLLSIFGVKYIVTLSSMVMTDLEKKTFGLKKKFKLIYWGVDTSQFYQRTDEEKQRLRVKLGLPIDKKIIGFVGRYEVWKGHETFLIAASQLSKTRGDLFFLIVGGAMTEDIVPSVVRYRKKVLQRIDELKLQDYLTVWGHRDDIPDIMASLDVFVCPSDQEPFGLVVLEALASRIPTVLSNTVGAFEVVKDVPNVYIAEPKDPQSFVNQIIKALEDNNKNRYILLNHSITSRLTWSEYTMQFEKLYRATASRS